MQLCVQAVRAALLQSWRAQTLLLLSFGLFFFGLCFFSFFFFLWFISPSSPQQRINYSECEQIVVVAREAVTEERKGEERLPPLCSVCLQVPFGSRAEGKKAAVVFGGGIHAARAVELEASRLQTRRVW